MPTNMIVYLRDNEFMGFVEKAGADEIKGSAKDAGYEVEDYGTYFNVIYAPIVKVEAMVRK
jgi:hypothetical protein